LRDLLVSCERQLVSFSAKLRQPHNPTGTISNPTTFKAFLSEIALKTIVIVDEAYLEFKPDFENKTALELTQNGQSVIMFRIFAKIYGSQSRWSQAAATASGAGMSRLPAGARPAKRGSLRQLARK
jgi:histidinol-phosphate aminotransferase